MWFPAASSMLACCFAAALGQEVISDLGDLIAPSPADERRALSLKAEDFWRSVLGSAQDLRMAEHLELFSATEEVIADLPLENQYVREALKEVLAKLRRADESVLVQTVRSTDLASEKLVAGPEGESLYSFFTGGQNFLSEALRRFVAGGQYPERLIDHVNQRQADILPVLRGAAGSAGDVLGDTRGASKRAFDVLKYDIYNKGVPKTPQAAKDLAYKLVDAAGETRHRFMHFVTQTVNGVARDFEGRRDGAAATVTRAELRGFAASDVQAAGSVAAAAAATANVISM